MANQFTHTLDEIERQLLDWKSNGIVIEPLMVCVHDLRKHTDDIEKIESSTDAIREEVIGPIRTELDKTRKAGRFSILGFWTGAIGFAITLGGLLFTTFGRPSPTLSEIVKGIQAANVQQKEHGKPTMILASSETLIRSGRFVLGTWRDGEVSMVLTEIRSDGAQAMFYFGASPFWPSFEDDPIIVTSQAAVASSQDNGPARLPSRTVNMKFLHVGDTVRLGQRALYLERTVLPSTYGGEEAGGVVVVSRLLP